MYSKKFWLDAFERAVATLAESLIALLTVDAAGAPLNWIHMLSVAAIATFVSLLKSIVASRTGDSQSASFIGTNIEESGR